MRFASETSFAELCRQATNKSLPGPDPTLNGMIISRIKSGKVHSQEVVNVLISRLQQKRPHKVHLALNIVQLVFCECPNIFERQQQGQLLGEVSRFAQSPMDRFSKDLRSGQQAKVLAFEILGNMQGAAQSPRPRGAETGAADTAHNEQPVEVTESSVRALIARAESQIELVQEAVLPLCGSDASTVSDGDAKFLDASVAALRAYQNDLEGAVNVLASHSSEATSRLMSECLKSVDALHTTMALHDEVMQARQIPPTETPPMHTSPTPTQPTVPPQQQPESQTLLPGFDSHESGPSARAEAGQGLQAPATTTTDQSVLKQMGWL